MSKTVSVININGRRYDASSGFVMDGVKRLVTKKSAASAATIKRRTAPKNHPKAAAVRTVSSSAKAVHKRQEKSQTLLREVVFKPSIKIKSASTHLGRTGSKSAIKLVDSARQSRARLIKKHPAIERFGAPKARASEALSGELIPPAAKPTIKAQQVPAAANTVASSASHNRLERLLDEALLRADAHKQAVNGTRSGILGLPRRLSLLLVIILLVALAILIVWLNVPAVAVKVANVRSHVNASLPAYAPSGFTFDKATSQPDKVNINYKASGGGAYTLGEQKSSLDSKSLSEGTLGASRQVQTSQVNGTTVYIYGPADNATWVNNGILYTISNQANLSSDQILQIVQSL